MSKTLHLGLPYLAAAQAQKHVTLNESLQRLDNLVQLAVLDRNLAAPPVSPAEGARYIVAAGATGDWAGQDNQIAVWQDGAWMFLAPKEGWLAWVADEDKLVVWTTVSWSEIVGGGGGGGATTFLALTDTPAAYVGQGAKFVRVTAGETALEFATPPATEQTARLGVNTAPSSTDRLSVAGASSRFTHAGSGGHQLKLNKAAAADTASVVFQRADSGRAEFGLVASDTFQLKVSADGAAWVTALQFDHTSGNATFNGRVGIGTDSPEYQLHLKGPAAIAKFERRHDLYSPGVLLVRLKSDGSGLANGDEIGKLQYQTFNSNGAIADAALIRCVLEQNAPQPLARLAFAVGGSDRISILPSGGLQLSSYVKTALPSASPAGQLIYVSNDAAGPTVAFSDGTNWRRVHDRAVVS